MSRKPLYAEIPRCCGCPEILKLGNDILRMPFSQVEHVPLSAQDSPILSLLIQLLFTPQSVSVWTLNYMATLSLDHLAVNGKQKLGQKEARPRQASSRAATPSI